MARPILCCLLAALLAGCGSSLHGVRSGRAWKNARPSDFKAIPADVLAVVERFLSDREFEITYAEEESLVKGFRPEDRRFGKDVALHVRIEPGPKPGLTRVTAITGGAKREDRYHHARLIEELRETFPHGK